MAAQDEERIQILAEKTMLEMQRSVAENETEREKVESELLEVVRGMCERIIPKGERTGGATTRR